MPKRTKAKDKLNTEELGVFILTFGRPDNVKTIRTLRRKGYRGEIHLICSTDDERLDEYIAEYGDSVHVFEKDPQAQDMCDNFGKLGTITYARNAAYDIARKCGYRYFIQLDDDYHDFSFRFNDEGKHCSRIVKDITRVFRNLLAFYKAIPARTLAMAQNGDFVGGSAGGFAQAVQMKRKAMNSFICDVEDPVGFIGTMNEDVNTYVTKGSRGVLFFTYNFVSLAQAMTQTGEGGISELYLDSGTYVKSFYTVMQAPSCVKIGVMGTVYPRLHHKIAWSKAVPVIIREEHKKVK